jgi:hypothetical protein
MTTETDGKELIMPQRVEPWDQADEGSGINVIQAADVDWDLSRAALDDVEGLEEPLDVSRLRSILARAKDA